jgi:hypothetical protein
MQTLTYSHSKNLEFAEGKGRVRYSKEFSLDSANYEKTCP